jgi:hypothetical protein
LVYGTEDLTDKPWIGDAGSKLVDFRREG